MIRPEIVIKPWIKSTVADSVCLDREESEEIIDVR